MNDKFFSGTKPDLISEKAIKKIEKIFKNSNQHVSISDHLINIYQDYIRPNLFVLIAITFVVVFVVIRYYIKKTREENEMENEMAIKNEEIDETDETDEAGEKYETNVNNNVAINKKLDFVENDETISEISEGNLSVNTDDDCDNNYNNYDTVNKRQLKIDDVNNEYLSMRKNNSLLSDQYIKELHNKNTEKYTFDEMTRIIVEGK